MLRDEARYQVTEARQRGDRTDRQRVSQAITVLRWNRIGVRVVIGVFESVVR